MIQEITTTVTAVQEKAVITAAVPAIVQENPTLLPTAVTVTAVMAAEVSAAAEAVVSVTVATAVLQGTTMVQHHIPKN